MGAITPIASGLSQIAGTISTVNQIASTVQNISGNGQAVRQQELALQQLQERQNINLQQAKSEAALERARIDADNAARQEDRQRALRRAVAAQRANFGGSGLSSNSGSSEAVLLGMFEGNDVESAQDARRAQLLNAALDLDVANQSSLNVLQRTQLRQRQRLNDTLL
ncbi:MAG: hypothetical protein CBB87_08775 [Micavibrio sp. TMED27]|nr:transporter [Micavibrio sp.]OUT90754.1 MAG: hypothetical protein CBB87_08775 [Micavibrio sp. TMED27]|tara:strand:- start:1042 stop:1542 length:501 start_codon:yes stop_codon:yes gene_type:complete